MARVSGVMRARRFLAQLLSALFESRAPAGGIVAAIDSPIPDGVNYDLPEFRLPQNEPEIVIPADLRAPELASERQAYINAKLTEAGVDFHFQFDTPYNNKPPENLSSPVFSIPLREWTWQARRQVTERAHMAYERNPLAKRAVGIITLFAVGEGMTMSYSNEDVEAVLEEFRANPENCVEQYEKELCNDLQVDGELFIRFFPGEEGNTVIVPLLPWEIAWIKTDPNFIKRVESYHRQGATSDGTPGSYQYVVEDIAAKQVLHVTINKHSYEQRGRSDLFTILPWLRAYKDWLEDRARQNHWRGAMLLDLTLTGGTPQQVANKRAQLKQPPPPGSLYIHNDKEAMEYKDSKINANDVSEDGRQMKLMVAVGEGIPEYMLADGQNANLASASAQQLPALRTFGEYQDKMVNQIWRPIYKRVVENAIAKGTLADEVQEFDKDGQPVLDDAGEPKMIKAVDAFDVKAPELESDDPKTLADALVIAENQGWASKDTAASKAGYDYRVEKRKIEKEIDAEMVDRALGRKPGPLPDQQPQFNPADPDAVPGDGPDDAVPVGARPAVPKKNGKGPTPESEIDVQAEQFNKLLETIRDNARQPVAGPTIHNNLTLDSLPIAEALRAAPPVVNVSVPEQAAPHVTVNVPETTAPQVVVNVPEQPAPVVNVTTDAPVVNVTMPKPVSEKAKVMRDTEGKIIGTDTSIEYEV